MNIASPLLARVFRGLDEAEVEYCLLRGYDDLLTPALSQEVDLLLQPHHRREFQRVVEELGFVSWPAWGHEPHCFYVAYDAAEDCWFKLDVVESLRYGNPVRWLEVDLAARCLAKRRRREMAWIPSAEDQLITLLLHCVLDKKRFRDPQRARLMELWQEILPDRQAQKTLFGLLAAHLGRWEMLGVAQDFDLRDWDDFLLQRKRWMRRLFLRQPLLGPWRLLRTLVMRRIRRLLFLFRRHGTATVLLAPDGGGKSTLAASLARDPWLRAEVVYMGSNPAEPSFRLPMGPWLEARLRGERRVRFGPLRAVLSACGAMNRIVEDWCRHGMGRWHQTWGRFVVYDRYFYDLYLSPRSHTLRLRLRRWILQHTCAEPDLVLLLDAPAEVLHQRKGEHTPEMLDTQRQALLALGQHVRRFVVVDTTQGADSVRRRAIATIWERYATRYAKTPRAAEPRKVAPSIKPASVDANESARVI